MTSPTNPAGHLSEIASLSRHRPAIVLDDDPTGTQTIRDAVVLTSWSDDRLAKLLDNGEPLVFLLTNSRSLDVDDAARLARHVGEMLRFLVEKKRAGHAISVISRSDSTLRGHFPIEVDALAEGLGIPDARILLAPFFGDAGRVTINGVHYLRRGDRDIPIAETEFARDATFGYRASALSDWVAERSGNRDRHVGVVTLEAIRSGGPSAVSQALKALPPRGVLVVDAVEERDIEISALGALRAEQSGLPLIARTAASYVRARAGQAPVGVLSDSEFAQGEPGLLVVGSHVAATTEQIDALMADPPTRISTHELGVPALVRNPGSSTRIAKEIAASAKSALERGTSPVLITSRTVTHGTARSQLAIGDLVSRTIVDVVRRIDHRPAWILAKGGITSSVVATDALDIVEAEVVGPLLPGVPLWRSGTSSRWPRLDYVVFPGNVGSATAVRDAVVRLTGR